MPASTAVTFDDLALQLGKATHDFTTHQLKVALTNVAPDPAIDAVLADITEIAATGGYVAGGYAVAAESYVASAGIATLTCTDLVITAVGGDVGPFRYPVIYNDTAAGDPLVCYLDYGSALTLHDTETLTLDLGVNGIVQVTA